MWVTNGVIADAGNASSGAFSTLGTTGSGDTICARSGSSAYNLLCLGTTATGASLRLTNVGGTGGLSLLNGTATLTLPTNNGTTGYVLTTDGTGITSWAPAAGSGSTPGGASGAIQYNNSGVFGGFTMGGDCLLTIPNITCTKTNGSLFAASATIDTTVASNITSGTLPSARIAGSYTGITGTGALTAGSTGAGFTVAFGSATLTGQVPLANGGTNANLTASAGGIFYSTGSAAAILAGTGTPAQCLLSGTNSPPTWGSCSGAAAVSSVTAVDATVLIPGTTGAVTVGLNLGNANTWTAKQTYTNSDWALLGSSTGATTLTSDNAGASNFTMHVPAANDTLATIASTQTFTNKTWNGVAITGSFIATNTVANSNLAQMPTNTVKCNPTGTTANAQDCAITGVIFAPLAAFAGAL